MERRRSADDRRHHELYVSEGGRRALGQVREVAALHEDDLFAALDEEDRARLTELLGRVAEQQGLTPASTRATADCRSTRAERGRGGRDGVRDGAGARSVGMARGTALGRAARAWRAGAERGAEGRV